MKYIAILSGDLVDIAAFEIEQYCLARGRKFTVILHSMRMIIFDADEDIDFSGIGLATEISEYLGGDISGIDVSRLEKRVCVKGFKVTPDARVSELERKVGGIVTQAGLKIDMSAKCVLRVYGVGDRHLFGKLRYEADRKEMALRDAKNRPYFSAGTINAKLARGFVNLGRVSAGDSVLDPFCGSGAFLIEAGLHGCKVHGSDLSENHVAGARKNLESYGVREHDLKVMDALDSKKWKKKFDCVVTDLPWGKSTVMPIEKTEMYRKFMEMIPKILKKKRFAVIASDAPEIWHPAELKPVGKFEIYVHKSKKRYVNVFFYE